MPNDTYQSAILAFSEGRLEDAARYCAVVINTSSNVAEAWHLSGIVAARLGNIPDALVKLQTHQCLNPADADAWADLALIAHSLEIGTAAVSGFGRASLLDPNRLDWLENYGTLAQACNLTAASLSAWTHLTNLQPDQPKFWYQRAIAESQLGEPWKAIASLEQVIKRDPENFHALELIGRLLPEVGEYALATQYFQQFVTLYPQNTVALSIYGVVLIQAGDYKAAMETATTLIAVKPDGWEGYRNIANSWLELFKYDRAISFFQRTLVIEPNLPEVYNHYGLALQGAERLDDARLAFQQSMVLAPDNARLIYNLGILELSRGNFHDGLRFYEWRLQSNAARTAFYAGPVWNGGDLRGKHILIAQEQGLGDTLQICRYLPLLQALGAKVSFSIYQNLIPLFSDFAPDLTLVARDHPVEGFDCWLPMMSLPYMFQTRLHNIPAGIPYLSLSPQLIEETAAKLPPNGKKKIGLVWSGNPNHKNDRNRSIALDFIRPILAIDQFDFFALQIDIKDEDRAAYEDLTCSRLNPRPVEQTDLTATAALIMNMDLVISVDTAVAHLAGGLGKRFWLLLPTNPDWRWMLNRGDSPWYPSARIFRQHQQGDWTQVISDVCRALDQFTSDEMP